MMKVRVMEMFESEIKIWNVLDQKVEQIVGGGGGCGKGIYDKLYFEILVLLFAL